MSVLRVVDAGTVSAVLSQALWHGIATASTDEQPVTLSFCRPDATYVGLGYHTSLDEIDRSTCQRLELPLLRRQIGGGPVLVDPGQLFFQITIPAAQAPARTDRLYERYLGPAVDAFRAVGLDAHLRGVNDIAIQDRKISGTAAGRLRDGVTVVGNAIFRFPYETMAEVLAFPSAELRAEYLRLLRRHLSTLEAEGVAVSAERFKQALVRSYSAHLGLTPRSEGLDDAEEKAIDRWAAKLSDRDWLEGSSPRRRSCRQIKVCAGVWLYAARAAGLEVEASVVGGSIEHLSVRGDRLKSSLAEQLAVGGRSGNRESLEARLRRFGRVGSDLAELLRPALELR